jgi:hypothetical protein
VKFDYSAREVDPLSGESGPQVVFEPIVLVQCHGPARSYLIRGLLDTGASIRRRRYPARLTGRSWLANVGEHGRKSNGIYEYS